MTKKEIIEMLKVNEENAWQELKLWKDYKKEVEELGFVELTEFANNLIDVKRAVWSIVYNINKTILCTTKNTKNEQKQA